MKYQDYMTGISAEHIMAKMDYDRVSTDAHLYRTHKIGENSMGIISRLIEKLGELLVSTGESMIHYAEHHDEHHAAA